MILESFTSDLFLNLGGWLVLSSFVILSVVKGYLVPKKTVDWSIQLYDEALKRKEIEVYELKEANKILQKTVSLTTKNQSELLDAIQVNNELVKSVRETLR